MSLKALEKLRVSEDAAEYQWIRSDYLNQIADEIEAEWQDSYDAMCLEIERDYMKLPVDADGVPIHVGDEVEWINDNGKYKVCGVGELVALRTHASDCFTVGPNRLRHVKPRTLEDVLRDFAKEVNVSSSDFISVDGEEAYMLAAINETADEIRELMGGDAL